MADRLCEENKCKICYNHGDPNFLNVLVREGELDGDKSRIILNDFQCSVY